MSLLGRTFDSLAASFGYTRSRSRELRADSGGLFSFGSGSDAGVSVTADKALTHSVVWACVLAISDSFATLPVHVKRQKDGVTAADHQVHDLLHSNPNEFQGPAVFRTAMMTNALLWGRAIAVIERDEMGRPSGLYPVPSAGLRVDRVGGLMRYHVRDGNGWFTLRPDEVFDLMWQSIDGVTALNPIQYARHTVGLSLALNRYASSFFANGGNIGGVIKTGSMSPDAVKSFVASWKEKYVGSEKAYKLVPLPAGMDFTPIGVDPEKGQMTGTRAAQVLEVCRIFRVPPSKVMDFAAMKWSNIEHAQIAWMQDTMLPWAVRWEQEADRKLLLERERRRLEVKFNLDALLRADTESRTRALAAEVASGLRLLNEARATLNLPPVEGGDVPLRPANTVPLTYFPDKLPEPEPDDEPGDDPENPPTDEPEEDPDVQDEPDPA